VEPRLPSGSEPVQYSLYDMMASPLEKWPEWFSAKEFNRVLTEMVEYRDIAEGLHTMQETNGWCDCHKGGSNSICDLAKKLEELRKA